MHQQVHQRRHLQKEMFLFDLVILDAPTGMNSDIWIPLQEILKTKTTVNKS